MVATEQQASEQPPGRNPGYATESVPLRKLDSPHEMLASLNSRVH